MTHSTTSARTWRSGWTAWLAALCLSGCASAPTAPTSDAARTGALLVVRLIDRFDAPPSLRLDVTGDTGGAASALTARRQQSVPGQHADYFFVLALPPQRYVLSGLHAGGPGAAPALSLRVPFEVRAGDPVYLGRLTVAPGPRADTPLLAVHDRFDEDAVVFRQAIPALRQASIGRRPLAAESLQLQPAATSTSPAATVSQLDVEPLDGGAATALPPSAQAGFAQFLRLRAPRAFAVGPDGVFAHASRSGAVERAMRDCARMSRSQACRLFAVDDTLMAACAADGRACMSAERRRP